MSGSPFRLDGKSVLISGAGGGIGHALVAAFRAAGARIIGADRDPALLADLSLDDTIIFELGDSAATQSAITGYIEKSGVPDIVVANAGFTRAEVLEQLDIATWDSEVAINLNGAYAMTAPIVEAMAARGDGNLVFISSINGLSHYGNPAYSAAKAGLIAYAKAIAVERGGQGVRANVIAPGSVRTLAWDHRLAANPHVLDNVLPLYPLGRMVVPDEVANAAVFLSSPAASGITGAILPVDAGISAGNLHFVNDVLRAPK